MGHPGLHAVERPDGRYDCYRSQWDGLAVFEDGPPSPERVESDATVLAVDATATEVLELLDPLADDALFVHATDGRVTGYLVCWCGISTAPLDADGPTATTALVPVLDGSTAERLDCALRTAKAVLGDAVDADLLSRAAAERYLARFVATHPDVPDGVVWVPREVT